MNPMRCGYKLVPVEPTKEMLRAADDDGYTGHEGYRRAYAKMLAAAPQVRLPSPSAEAVARAALQIIKQQQSARLTPEQEEEVMRLADRWTHDSQYRELDAAAEAALRAKLESL